MDPKIVRRFTPPIQLPQLRLLKELSDAGINVPNLPARVLTQMRKDGLIEYIDENKLWFKLSAEGVEIVAAWKRAGFFV